MNHRTSTSSKLHVLSAALLSLAISGTFACNPTSRPGRPELGRLQLAVQGAEGTPPCEQTPALSGTFAVHGISNGRTLSIPSDELRRGQATRGDLPPGVYSVAWVPDGRSDGGRTPGTLPATVVTSVFGGRTTTVRVERGAAPNVLLTRTY